MGRKKSYQPWTQDQMFLMPPSMKEWLKEDHLVWFILDVVSELDISPVEKAIQRKDARGQRPYDPRMMVALLVYAYCTGVYSSRRMERACQENVAFRVITGNRQPYFTTINEFRRVHRKHFEGLFVEVLKLCREAGLVKLRHVAVDGTKVKANASRHKAMSYKRLVAEEKRLRKEVRRMLAEAEAADGAEDARHGEGVRGDELPEELKRRESRLKRLREAKERLEAEARKARARALREQADGMEATAANARVRKGLGGISIIALLIRTATGLRSLACASSPSAAPPAAARRPRQTDRGTREDSPGQTVPGHWGGQRCPHTPVANSAVSRAALASVPASGFAVQTPSTCSLAVFSQVTSSSSSRNRRSRSWLLDSSVGNRSGSAEGSSTIWAKITARAAARGRRAHQRCRVLGWPCRMDFSRLAAALIASRGRATSMSFLRVLKGGTHLYVIPYGAYCNMAGAVS